MKKHTPKPWIAERSGDGKYWGITGTSGGYFENLACEVDSDDKDPEVAEANVRLITASPLLLESLEDLVAFIDEIGSDASDCDRVRAAREALSEAKGGAP